MKFSYAFHARRILIFRHFSNLTIRLRCCIDNSQFIPFSFSHRNCYCHNLFLDRHDFSFLFRNNLKPVVSLLERILYSTIKTPCTVVYAYNNFESSGCCINFLSTSRINLAYLLISQSVFDEEHSFTFFFRFILNEITCHALWLLHGKALQPQVHAATV